MYFFPPWYELINKTHGITHTINNFSNLHCNLWGCSPGFHGDRCENKCRYPTFGLRCERKCDCRQQLCHFINGCPLPGDLNYFLK